MSNSVYLDSHDARTVSTRHHIGNGKRKVAMDVRVSTQHEMQINALGNQEQWALELARQHAEDWIFNSEKDLYVEEGISGTSLKRRPAFTEMIEKAKAGIYDLIVVREVCRFMRNARLTLDLVDDLRKCGVEVYFVNDAIWTFNEEDYFKLSDVLAKLELLRNFHVLFRGEFMGSVFTRNAFIRENRLHYKLKYIEKMEVFMELLCVQGDYSGVEGYCNDILKMYPDSADIHFWRIVALYKQGCIDSVREIDENLRDLLDERTYSILCRRLQLELNITDEILKACQESKGVFMRLDEEKRKMQTH